MQPLLVNPQEIRGIVTMAEAVDAVRLGFREWGENPQLNAPRRRIHIPSGVRVSVHQGGVPAAKATGLMTHCEWVKPMAEEQVYPRLNHPVIVLYDSAEGELKGIIVGEITCAELPNNIAVTGLRTAATSAVGTDLLARPDATRLGLFGAAGQAKEDHELHDRKATTGFLHLGLRKALLIGGGIGHLRGGAVHGFN